MVNRKRGGSCKVAAENSRQFHSDLLSEILLRLPAKSLVNLKRVSRQWYDLISSTQFCVEHTRRNPNPRATGIFLIRCPTPEAVRYLRFRKDYSVQNHTMDFLKFPKGINLIDSSNGLLLLLYNSRGPCKQDSWKWDRDSKLYVCNPTTKQVSKIPQLVGIRDGWFPQLIMCFDPTTPGKYRVVCVWNFSDQWHVNFIDVYESETGSWRHSAAASAVGCVLAGGVFWNGAVHWVDHEGHALYCFDLNRGHFRTSMLLPEPSGSEHRFDIRACGGHLYVLTVDKTYPFTKKVYEIDHDLSGFSMKYSIRFDSYSLRVLGVFRGEEGDQPFIVTCDGLQAYTHIASLSNCVPGRTDLSRSHHPSYWDFYDCIHSESLAPV